MNSFSRTLGRRFYVLAAGVAILAAFFVRLPALRERSWWIDELITAQVAARPFWGPDVWDRTRIPRESLLGFTLQDTGPGPLTYVLEGVFAKLAHPNGGEQWLRLPGILAAILSVVVITVFGWRWWASRRVAAIVALLAAIFPPFVDWSTSARGYMWTILVGVLHIATLQTEADARRAAYSQSRPMAWFLLSVLGIIAFYLSPLNVAWVLGFWVGLGYLEFRRNEEIGLPARWRFAIGALVLWCMGCLPYLVVWLGRLASKGPFNEQTASWPLVMNRVRDFWDEVVRFPSYLVLVLGSPLLFSFAARRRWRYWHHRPIILALGCALFGIAILAAALVTRFFLAPRYFVSFSLLLLWSVGWIFKDAWGALRLAFGRNVAQRIIVTATAFLCVLQVPASLYYAKTPVHDWLNAVRWLTAQIRHDDVVLCGPNADIEVLWAYSKSYGWDSQVPRWLVVDKDKKVDTGSEEALRLLLKTQYRLWFITPFIDKVRPRMYWKLIHENFHVEKKFPGRGELLILRRDLSEKR